MRRRPRRGGRSVGSSRRSGPSRVAASGRGGGDDGRSAFVRRSAGTSRGVRVVRRRSRVAVAGARLGGSADLAATSEERTARSPFVP
ncbi:hypothetical protein ACHAWF_000620 [Thalassiosira exigua]